MKIPHDWATSEWTRNPRRAPGKKLGTLRIEVDRKIDRWHNATIKIDVRVDSRGMFYAEYQGQWFKCETQAELKAELTQAIDATVNLTWRRYLRIRYRATAYPVGAHGAGREHTNIDLDDSRAAILAGNEDEPAAEVTGLSIGWEVVEYSDPFERPEDPGTFRRMMREVENGVPQERDAEEVEVDLPVGLVLWTAERERVLEQIVSALGQLDARLAAMFTGAADELATRLDGFDASRLLGGGS